MNLAMSSRTAIRQCSITTTISSRLLVSRSPSTMPTRSAMMDTESDARHRMSIFVTIAKYATISRKKPQFPSPSAPEYMGLRESSTSFHASVFRSTMLFTKASSDAGGKAIANSVMYPNCTTISLISFIEPAYSGRLRSRSSRSTSGMLSASLMCRSSMGETPLPHTAIARSRSRSITSSKGWIAPSCREERSAKSSASESSESLDACDEGGPSAGALRAVRLSGAPCRRCGRRGERLGPCIERSRGLRPRVKLRVIDGSPGAAVSPASTRRRHSACCATTGSACDCMLGASKRSLTRSR
mmetsp:Transcript_7081/g.18143  ORF Transcript_7081/g.18143 Transcript_7081/m.18143 type:complete len:300 (-) Transcript_7081:238-1137(-)